MMTSHAFLVVVTIETDVEVVFGSEFFHHVIDVVHSFGAFSHCCGGEVGVAARSVPVWEQFGCEGDVDVVIFSDAAENITRHPKVVSNGNTGAWSNLELPLTWHNLGISSGNVNSSGEACTVVGVGDDSTKAHVSSNRAVVWALRSWVAVRWPSKWPLCELVGGSKECKFLLDSKPWFFFDSLWMAENLISEVSEVGVGWNQLLAGSVFPHECVAHHKDVVTSTEWVREVGYWSHDNFRIFSGGLVAAGTIVIPLWKVFKFFNFLFKCAAFASESDATSVNPDVFGDDLSSLVEGLVLLWVLVVKNAAGAFHVVLILNE